MPTLTTRFAPSPTGYLHVGGARTALFNWLLARHTGGKFLLRIEDTDLNRSTEQAAEQLLSDLRWLGLQWDNPELVYQSKRTHVYNAVIADLMKRDLAYEAWESREEIDALRDAAAKQKKSFVYRRPRYTSDQIQRFKSEGRVPVIRFAMPVKDYSFRDEVLQKDVTLQADQVQDFVIRKADGMPTYHFAVVVDDAEMQATHILRGQEHINNTFNHLALQEALGYPRPVYAHLTTIQNLDGSKMGKRDRDKAIRARALTWLKTYKKEFTEIAAASNLDPARFKTWLDDSKQQLDLDEQLAVMNVIGLGKGDLPEILVHDFRANGYLPEVLLNFIALLGWNPGGDRERMTIDEMTQLFGLDRVGVANPKFSRDKLLAFNTEALKESPLDRRVRAFRDYLGANPESPINAATDEQLAHLLNMKPGIRTLREIDEPSRFLFTADDQIQYDPAAVEKVLRKNNAEGAHALRDIRTILDTLPAWTAQSIESAVNDFCQQKQLGLGKVAQPIRVAVSGTTVSPPIFESLQFLGKDSTLKRIDRCLTLP